MPEIKADWKAILAFGGVALVFYFLAKHEAAKAITATEKAINPLSNENIFYQGASKLLAPPGQSLGTEVYNILHPGS